LDGYIPTLHNRAKLIENCEAIERNAAHKERTPSASEKSGKKKRRNAETKTAQANTQKVIVLITQVFTIEHGGNPTHATTDCFTINNRDKSGSEGVNRSFSNKSFRKEVNFLAKKSSKKKVLDMYATASSKREQKKIQKQIAKRKPREVASSDSKSDSDVSLHIIDSPKSKKSSTKSKTRTHERTLKSVARKKRAQKAETLQEEVAYEKKVQWLVDHGESDKDKPID
jgi:hypothetical protein